MAKKLGGWFYGILFTPGWPRRILLVAAVIVFLAAAFFLSSGTDYREDPSALVPRSIQFYAETNDLDALLRSAGTWRMWQAERRGAPGDQYNRLQVDIAERIGRRVAGLGTRPLRWLVGAGRAAYCVNREEEGGESWALILHVPELNKALSELAVEPNMTLETVEGAIGNGISRLTGKGAGNGGEPLFFGTLSPWLIISSAETLPRFAMESARRPAFSLSGSGILPDWRRGASLRGVFAPAHLSAYSIVADWVDPGMRINFVAAFRNGLETTFDAAMLTDRPKGGGLLWPLFWILALLAAIASALLVLAIVLVMIGWGGWLKIRAVRAGIDPAPAPVEAPLSNAFREDAGIDVESLQTPKGNSDNNSEISATDIAGPAENTSNISKEVEDRTTKSE